MRWNGQVLLYNGYPTLQSKCMQILNCSCLEQLGSIEEVKLIGFNLITMSPPYGALYNCTTVLCEVSLRLFVLKLRTESFFRFIYFLFFFSSLFDVASTLKIMNTGSKNPAVKPHKPGIVQLAENESKFEYICDWMIAIQK